MKSKSVHVKLPDGRGSDVGDDARTALLDPTCWTAASSEMYLSVRTESEHSMLTVIRREEIGVCLMCFEAGEEPPGYVSLGERCGDRKFSVELQDVTIFYPEQFFISLELACAALDEFLARHRREQQVRWRPLRLDELGYEYT